MKNAGTKRTQEQQSSEIDKRVLTDKQEPMQAGQELKPGIGAAEAKENNANHSIARGVQTVMVKTATLVPYARNPRKNDAVVDRMLASIREFGFKVPILIQSDGAVIDGHLRIKAAQQAGMEEVPAILCDEWSAAQVKAFRLLANRSVNWAEWDQELVALEIADLEAMGFDLDLTGFDADEIEVFQLAGQDGRTAEDAVPEPPPLPVTGPGDLWILGEHRLLCGDASVPADVGRLLGNVEPGLMVTDTANFRYPHYHTQADTPDKIDYERTARVVLGVEAVIRDLAASGD